MKPNTEVFKRKKILIFKKSQSVIEEESIWKSQFFQRLSALVYIFKTVGAHESYFWNLNFWVEH